MKNNVSFKSKPSNKQLNFLLPKKPLELLNIRKISKVPDIGVESLSNERQSIYSSSVGGLSLGGLRPTNSNRSRPPSSQRLRF